MIQVQKTWTCLIGLLLLGQIPVFSQQKISTSFDVQLCDRNTVAIQWTRPGTDSIDYVLESSTDGKRWEMVADISSQPSPYYDYIDLHRAGNIYYYRILQRKSDELVAVSDTKFIVVTDPDKLYVWPTPANGVLHVRSPFKKGNMDIIDSDGRFIWKVAITDSITNVQVQALPAGMYIIHARNGKDVLVDKFIKQQNN
jgi:hypothetical protein